MAPARMTWQLFHLAMAFPRHMSIDVATVLGSKPSHGMLSPLLSGPRSRSSGHALAMQANCGLAKLVLSTNHPPTRLDCGSTGLLFPKQPALSRVCVCVCALPFEVGHRLPQASEFAMDPMGTSKKSGHHKLQLGRLAAGEAKASPERRRRALMAAAVAKEDPQAEDFATEEDP